MVKIELEVEPGKGYIVYVESEYNYNSIGFSDLELSLNRCVEAIRRIFLYKGKKYTWRWKNERRT